MTTPLEKVFIEAECHAHVLHLAGSPLLAGSIRQDVEEARAEVDRLRQLAQITTGPPPLEVSPEDWQELFLEQLEARPPDPFSHKEALDELALLAMDAYSSESFVAIDYGPGNTALPPGVLLSLATEPRIGSGMVSTVKTFVCSGLTLLDACQALKRYRQRNPLTPKENPNP